MPAGGEGKTEISHRGTNSSPMTWRQAAPSARPGLSGIPQQRGCPLRGRSAPARPSRPGMQVAFYKFANPGFVVRNSTIEDGTGALQRRVRRFDVFGSMWKMSFCGGPIPRDITFRNCTFTTPYDADAKIFHGHPGEKRTAQLRVQM